MSNSSRFCIISYDRLKLNRLVGRDLNAKQQNILLQKLLDNKPFRLRLSTKTTSAYAYIIASCVGQECTLTRYPRDYDPPWLSPRQLRALNDYLIKKALSRYPSDSNISDFGDYRDFYGLGPEDWGDI
jgi:hypothetical protein